MRVVEEFYTKYFNDTIQRNLILGINPGRFGAGVKGIKFTDTVRLSCYCGIQMKGLVSRELSSEFMYEMIDRFGGANDFYKKFFVSAVCPLGFTAATGKGKEVNYNYYDSNSLLAAVYDFIIENLKKQLGFGIRRNKCFCLGTGKNFRFLSEINKEYGFFKAVVPLEHPRFIMQYRRRSIESLINKYLVELTRV